MAFAKYRERTTHFAKDEMVPANVFVTRPAPVAQLTQQLLPIIEVGSSNPVFGKKLTGEMTGKEKTRPRMAV